MAAKSMSTWIPIGSFGLALALSFAAGSPHRFALARQASDSTGCECKFNVMSQTGTVTWQTEGPKSAVLSKFSITHSATACVSSKFPAGGVWIGLWTATNLSVTYTAKITIPGKGVESIEKINVVVPFQYGGVFGKTPCKPAADTETMLKKVDLASLKDSLESTIGGMIAGPGGDQTNIKVTVHSVSLAPTFDTQLSASGACGEKVGPLALSIGTYGTPKDAKKGQSTNTLTYAESCP